MRWLYIVRPVDFQVLGPLRVEDAGREFPLGGPKQRTLLALLVAAAGTAVPMDRLLMGVYGPDADPKARRTLHTYISRYRSALGDVIQRRGEGYALAVEPISIDAVRFENSVRRAKSLVDPSESTEVLRAALGLWRGPPYADVETEALAAEARRLEELKAEAVEARVALDLATGRHRELVAELEALVAHDPRRERLRAHQMLALYRCGRQADALAAYRSTVAYLRDELGLDPSPDLQRLEQQILHQDAALDFRPRPRPRSLPARYTTFVGRSSELAEAQQLLATHRLVTITGPGGVGKSSLAVEVARSLTDRMEAVFVPMEAERQVPPRLLVAQSLGLRPAEHADVQAMVATALGAGPTLLLLDGCEHVIGELPAVIAELLQRSPGLRILVTSREPLFMTGERRLVLEPLPVGADSPATRLFIERAAIRRDELDRKTLEAADRIAAEVSGLPLGIELAAARHRTMSLEQIAAQLGEQTQLLSTKRGPEPRHLSIVAALDWSYRALDDDHQRTFRQLAVFPTGMVPTDGAAVVLADDAPASALQVLADLSLLSPPDREGRFRILEPIRQYAAMLLDEAGERLPAERRHTEWLVGLGGELRHLVMMGHSSRALPRLRAQAPAIAAVASWALEHDEPDIVLDIVAAVGRLWPRVADPRSLREPALAVLEGLGTPLSDAAVAALANTAVLYRLDEPDVAMDLGVRLQAEAQRIADPATLQIVDSALAVIPYGASRRLEPDSAARCLAHWQASVDLLGDLGYPAEPQYRNGVILLNTLGRRDEAEELLRSMIEFADENRPAERGSALEVLADFQLFRGEHTAAVTTCREAARLLIEGGDLDIAAEAETRRAWAHCLLGEYERAEEAVRRSDEYHALIGLPPAAEEAPLLVASIAAGASRWDDFLAALRAFFASAPAPTDGAAYEDFLIGDATTGTHFVRMIEPLARWLMARGRRAAAAALVGAAPMAFEASAFVAWEQVGDVARVERVAAELGSVDSPDAPTTLDELYRYIRVCSAAP